MDKQQLTFNDIPVAPGEILERLERIGAILSELKTGTNDEDNKWMNIEEFIEYLPNHPSKGIIYKWACGREIPFHKQGKYVLFKRSEIDKWLDGRRIKTHEEIREEAHREYQRRFRR